MVAVPVVPLEPDALKEWARVVVGCGDAQVPGRQFELTLENRQWRGPIRAVKPLPESGEQRFWSFAENASPMAKELAGLMSFGPVSPEITNLIQSTLLPASEPIHVAEVFLSGLLEVSEQGRYEFVSGVQEHLQQSMLDIDKRLVFRVLSDYVSKLYNQTPLEFRAFLQRHSDWSDEQWDQLGGFAELRQRVQDKEEQLFINSDDRQSVVSPDFQGETGMDDIHHLFPGLPSLSDISCDVPTDVLESVVPTAQDEVLGALVPEPIPVRVVTVTVLPDTLGLSTVVKPLSVITFSPLSSLSKSFSFRLVKLERQGNPFARLFQQSRGWYLNPRSYENYSYTEQLSPDLDLELAQIPSGTFMMGSPSDEPERYDDESPQHKVTFASGFWMGRYPVTQSQWRFVSGLTPVNRKLESDPSQFKGANRPVEQVSWYEAVEFCDRLTQHTGRTYRLPTEAEWEYACRAKTRTVFHFGDMITPGVANYDGRESYANGPKGRYREETTPVTEFNLANVFGLSDMHGNVWEWCLDHWHKNYNGAPGDGSAWIEGGSIDGQSPVKDQRRVVRGGSWYLNPRNCRSASRYRSNPDVRSSNIGFRVVLAPR
ncbi:MAG: formylglycine-generating enzyme family protein [Symploca sp. SIO2B6]|nr:formylglycine-generating enzyme family protein [Symploca sp. SIO2B6]